jgi:hypothetical protein
VAGVVSSTPGQWHGQVLDPGSRNTSDPFDRNRPLLAPAQVLQGTNQARQIRRAELKGHDNGSNPGFRYVQVGTGE